jgi:hypothetical protein
MGVANRDGARLFFIPFSPKSCNVAKLQCCRVLFDVGAAESELFVFDMNSYDEIFNFAINIMCATY